ncbi:hypothetical protein J2X26_001652 [Cellulomonas humilata]|uniref:Uncharacterized protein n=1 Tax=Cellulomonas humilata TaxID=144055 RepID=A0ABU0EE41_9CELL|nr:hypothetical protein [Cellulomonas humilata]
MRGWPAVPRARGRVRRPGRHPSQGCDGARDDGAALPVHS